MSSKESLICRKRKSRVRSDLFQSLPSGISGVVLFSFLAVPPPYHLVEGTTPPSALTTVCSHVSMAALKVDELLLTAFYATRLQTP